MSDLKDNKDDNEISVGGFKFYSEEAAQEAKDELNAIQYISSKTNAKDPKQVYVLYNRIIDQDLFNTQVGMNYLKELQQFLYISKDIPNERIRPIPIEKNLSMTLKDRRIQMEHMTEFKEMQKQNNKYKKNLSALIIVNILLVVVIIGMAFITIFSKNTNVVNYEVNLQNKYASWEEQLQSEEQSINDREKALDRKINNTK